MPATSQAQATAMAIAEHAPGKLYKRNKGMLNMSHRQLHDFAATSRKGLPKHAKKTSVGEMMGAKKRDSDSDYD